MPGAMSLPNPRGTAFPRVLRTAVLALALAVLATASAASAGERKTTSSVRAWVGNYGARRARRFFRCSVRPALWNSLQVCAS